MGLPMASQETPTGAQSHIKKWTDNYRLRESVHGDSGPSTFLEQVGHYEQSGNPYEREANFKKKKSNILKSSRMSPL